MRQIFVDGYNVINSWPELKEIIEYSFEAAREKLIDMLMNYSSYNGCKIILVFDAHLVKGNPGKKERRENVQVVFTKEGETADSYIEKTVNKIGREYEVFVVTSDFLEQQVTFQRGANIISSRQFHSWIREENKNISTKHEQRYSLNRNYLMESIDKEVLQILEQIRNSE